MFIDTERDKRDKKEESPSFGNKNVTNLLLQITSNFQFNLNIKFIE